MGIRQRKRETIPRLAEKTPYGCAARLTPKADCSPTAIWRSCWPNRTAASPRCSPSTNAPADRSCRATLHDVGTALTHKRIICYKRFAEGKEPHLVARQTWPTLEAVDRCLGQYDRVRCCRQQGLTPEQTAHLLGCSLALVQEYLRIDDELQTLAKETST